MAGVEELLRLVLPGFRVEKGQEMVQVGVGSVSKWPVTDPGYFLLVAKGNVGTGLFMLSGIK